MGKDGEGSRRSRGWNVRSLELAALFLIVLAGVGVGARALSSPPRLSPAEPPGSSNAAVPAVARWETRPTLDPALFVGKARLAHQVAREIPDVLDQLSCYCECERYLGHKNLLSCYTDGHAVT